MIDIGTLTGHISLEDQATAAITIFQHNLQTIGGSFTTVGAALSVGITAPLVGAAAASLVMSANFETTTTKMVSLAGVTAEQIGGVRKEILSLAVEAGIGPQALAEGFMKISSTVSDTTTALEIVKMAAKGSAAGMGTVVAVGGALTAVLNSYEKGSITAAHAADVLTKAVQDGGAEASELAPTLANVVPIAAQLGVSFEEVAANIATVTKLGVPANQAVTQLGAVFTALLKETKQGGEALATVGMSFESLRASVKDRGLAATLKDLTERFGENKTGLTDVFGRVEALRNIMSAAGPAMAETYTKELVRMKEAAGSLDIAFDAMKGTQMQSWNQISAALGVAAIKFGDALAPAMTSVLRVALPIVDMVGDLAHWFGELSQPIQAVAIVMGGVAAAAGPVVFVLGNMAAAVSALVPVMVWLGVSGVTTGAGLTIAGAGATAAGAASATAAPGVTALGVAMKLLTGVGIVGLLAALGAGLYQVGLAVAALHNAWKDGASMWAFFTKKEDDNFVRALLRSMGLLSPLVVETGWAFEGATAKITDFVGPMQEADDAVKDMRSGMSDLVIITDTHKATVKGLLESVVAAKEEFGATNDAWDKQALAIKLSTEAAAVWLPKLDAIIASGRQLTEQQVDYYKSQTTSRINTEATNVALLSAQGVTLQQVEALRAHGLSEKELAVALGTTTTALATYSDQLGIAREQGQRLAAIEMDLHGTLTQRAVAGFNEVYESKVRLLDASTEAGREAIAKEGEIRDADTNKQLLDLDVLRKARRSTRQDDMIRAKATYSEMLLHANDYYHADIEAARLNVLSKVESFRTGLDSVASSVAGIGSASTAAAGQVRTLTGELISAADAKKRLAEGGSSELRSLTKKQFDEEGGKARIAQLENFMNQVGVNGYDGMLAKQRAHVLLEELKRFLASNQASSGPNGTVGPVGPNSPSGSSGGGGGRGPSGAGVAVNVAPGAVVMNYPIVKDKAAMDQFGQFAGDAILQRLINQGWRPPNK